MQVKAWIAGLAQALAPWSSEAEREARLFAAHWLGLPLRCLNLHLTDPCPDGGEQRLAAIVARRRQGEPLQYIIGSEEFMSLPFVVTPAVLIPRADTEAVVERALVLLRQQESPLAADIGTGSGAIAVSMAYYCPQARIQAVDCSAAALEIAQKNALCNQTAARILFLQGDLCSPLQGAFDLIVANPPYVTAQEMRELAAEVRREPVTALYGGIDGLDLYRRLIPQAYEKLAPGGRLLLEIGAGQRLSLIHICHNTALYQRRVRIQGFPCRR